MRFKFGEGKDEVDMSDYDTNMLDDFPLKFHSDQAVPNPVGMDIFNAGGSKHLDNRKRELFHQTAAKALFYVRELGQIFSLSYWYYVLE